ncbi:iridoid oxidase-like [Euphorbia lathyris]|uniref:iridoid oxidase-like n=1 Tax=Euphorbia lathyris TaxID=212925 RepID=UPI0033144EE0
MEHPSIFLLPFVILVLSAIFLHHRRRNSGNSQSPPGPPGWPIIGNLLDLGKLPHRTLNDMKQKYGDIIGVKLGSINTTVIQSSKAASYFFKNHDLSFADRSITQTMRLCEFNEGALSLLPYSSENWRVLRKLVTVDMLGIKKLNETAFVRRKCVDDMLNWIEEERILNSGGIKIAEFVFLMAFNLMGNLVFSVDLVDRKSKRCSEFVEALFGMLEMSEKIEVIDFFPWLNWLNKLGWRRKMERRVGEALKIASVLVEERVEEKKKKMNLRRNDFADVLIDFQGNGKDEPFEIPQHNLNVLMLEMHMALAENVGLIIEWAFSELLRNQDAMKKAKAELSSIIGLNNKVEETDIDNLPYLQSIIKETLRLHTPVPLLVPKKAREDTKFMGYDIPKNTQVFINVWAIGRDPLLWNDPLSFKPERFMDSNVDFKGHHFELLPFGAGRRICAGLSLADRVVHLVLGSLLHQFDWELGGGELNPATMDMRERSGITMRKLKPLLMVPTKSKIE